MQSSFVRAAAESSSTCSSHNHSSSNICTCRRSESHLSSKVCVHASSVLDQLSCVMMGIVGTTAPASRQLVRSRPSSTSHELHTTQQAASLPEMALLRAFVTDERQSHSREQHDAQQAQAGGRLQAHTVHARLVHGAVLMSRVAMLHAVPCSDVCQQGRRARSQEGRQSKHELSSSGHAESAGEKCVQKWRRAGSPSAEQAV